MPKTYNPFNYRELNTEADIRDDADLRAWTKINARKAPGIGASLHSLARPELTDISQVRDQIDAGRWMAANPGSEEAKEKFRSYGGKVYDDWQSKHLGEDNPLPWQKYLPVDAVEMGDEFNRRPESYFTDGMNEGVDRSDMFEAARSPMEAAIAKKYRSQYGNKLSGLKAAGAVEGKARYGKEMARAADVYGKQQQIRMQNFKEQYEYQERRRQIYNQWVQAQNAAKGSWLSTVLGGLGTIGGFLLGGPAGAMAGAAAGGMAGGAAAPKTTSQGFPQNTGGAAG